MLSVAQTYLRPELLEEAFSGGMSIAYDPKNRLLLYVSPDSGRYGDGLAEPDKANEYFKILNGQNYNKSNMISRIGFRNPQYEMHEVNNRQYPTVFLKPKTVENVIRLLNSPYSIPNKPHIQAQWNDLLNAKNRQINEYNRLTGNNVESLPYFTNWHAAIIYTNQINKLQPMDTVLNDRRFLGKSQVHRNYLPFDLPIPNYQEGLRQSELERRANKDYRSLGRY